MGDEIRLDHRREDGSLLRWTLFDIEAGAFRWRNEESSDGGRTWTRRQGMKARRRMTVAA